MYGPYTEYVDGQKSGPAALITPGARPNLDWRSDMANLHESEDGKTRETLLRHALTSAAAAIADLLADHPTAADARATARAWLKTFQTFQFAGAIGGAQ